MIKYDLNNRVAIVTGGAQGFGLAVTERFIEAGAKVVIWDIDKDAIKKALDKVNSENLELKEAIKRRTVELDLKNRELEIEAALEKVRSCTMAMQHSDELQETANKLFLEVQALGIPSWSCGFNILSEDKTTCHINRAV